MKDENIKPPYFCRWILDRLLDGTEHSPVIGDFEEIYTEIYREDGRWKAFFWYFLHLIRLIPRYFYESIFWRSIMLRNYVIVIIRNIRKYKMYSFINIAGLSVGMACSLILFLLLQFELSYDRYHEKADRIFRVVTEGHPSTPAPTGPAMKNDFPEVVDYVRIEDYGGVFRYGDKMFYEDRFYLADNSVFQVFSLPFLSGDPNTALVEPHSLVLTESAARKYFGNENPVGKTLTHSSRIDFTVTGVIKDLPPNSHLRFELLVPFETLREFSRFDYVSAWNTWNFSSYVLLREGTDPKQVEEKTPALLQKYWGSDSLGPTLYLQPVKDIHLRSDIWGGSRVEVDIRYMYIFGAVGLFLLVLACLNFTNLATAQSLKRSKEVGLRKVFGAQKGQLVEQFIGESVILACLALPVTFLLVYMFLPKFNEISGLPLSFSQTGSGAILIGVVSIIAFAGLVSGSYPGIFASSFQPIQVIQNRLLTRTKGPTFRNILVIFQFVVSVVFIAGTLIVSRQMNYIRNTDLGMNRDNVVVLGSPGKSRLDALKKELLTISSVINVEGSSFLPTSNTSNQSVVWEGMPEEAEPMMRWITVGYDFVETLGIEVVQGRDFSEEFPADMRQGYLLNESAVKFIGWDDSVNKKFDIVGAGSTDGRVVGVVRDFHFRSLHHRVEPLAILLYPSSSHIYIRIAPHNTASTLGEIRSAWQRVVNDRPFNYFFLDENFARLYRIETVMEKFVMSFAGLAVLLACMGLFGLASFIMEYRMREIGIRKVFGASVYRILTIELVKFLKILAVSCIIAFPVIYFMMSAWLKNFAYRIDIGWWSFIAAGAIVISAALITVSYQSVKAARANPIDTIRYE